MEDDKWTKVVNQKRQKRKIKQKGIEEEKNKWELLKNEVPHVVLPIRAKRLQTKLNIDKLERRLLSDQFIEYQKQGWKYVKVLKSSDNGISNKIPPNTRDFSYSVLGLDNGWGDAVLFSMALEKKGEKMKVSPPRSEDSSSERVDEDSE